MAAADTEAENVRHLSGSQAAVHLVDDAGVPVRVLRLGTWLAVAARETRRAPVVQVVISFAGKS